MMRVGFYVAMTILILCGSCKRSSPSSKAGVETVLAQGPVSAWRIPFDRESEGTIVCRYVVTGEEAREYPIDGDSLMLTTVDQDGVLTIVHGSAGSAMSSSITLKISHPADSDVRMQGPDAIKVGMEERTVWKQSWESPETRKEIFAVELKARLKPKRKGDD